MQGGIIDKDMPMPASNVAIMCPKGHPTRVGYESNNEGEKRRVCKKCGADLG
jgi:large subunit ribosomal protein L24